VQVGPWPFPASCPFRVHHHSVSEPRHIEPDRRDDRIRLTTKASSHRGYASVRPDAGFREAVVPHPVVSVEAPGSVHHLSTPPLPAESPSPRSFRHESPHLSLDVLLHLAERLRRVSHPEVVDPASPDAVHPLRHGPYRQSPAVSQGVSHLSQHLGHLLLSGTRVRLPLPVLGLLSHRNSKPRKAKFPPRSGIITVRVFSALSDTPIASASRQEGYWRNRPVISNSTRRARVSCS
jgi:hypothetical protein